MDQCSLKMERDQVRVEFQGSEAFAVEHLIPVLAKIDWKERVSDAGSSFERNLAIRTTHAICMRIGHKSGADLACRRRPTLPDRRGDPILAQPASPRSQIGPRDLQAQHARQQRLRLHPQPARQRSAGAGG